MREDYFGNIGGILMGGDVAQCTFKYVNGILQTDSIQILDPELRNLPVMLMIDLYKQFYWNLFLSDQVAPRNRYRLLEDLAIDTPIRAYIPEQLLRWSYCRNVANDWWVKVDEDLTCWEEWQIPEVKKYFNIK